MTAKQYWFRTFKGQSIFEVMQAYADLKLKENQETLKCVEEQLEELQKRHTKLLFSTKNEIVE